MGVTSAFFGGLVTWATQRRKRSAETIAAELGTSASLLARVEELTGKFITEQESREECEDRCLRMERELRLIKDVVPSLALEEHVQRLSPSLLAVLQGSSEGWVISTPSDGARWLHANDTLCDELGYTLDEILERGWRRLIAKEDLLPTTAVETSQWAETVTCVNHYVKKDGSRVLIRWLGMRYSNGFALSRARFLRRAEDDV